MNDEAIAAIRVALVDDHAGLRAEVSSMLAASPGFVFVGAAPDAEMALREIPPLCPHVILMDIELPGRSGVECVREMRSLLPDTQIMMLTVFEDYELIFESIRVGATGYLLKKNLRNKLLDAIADLHEGGSPMSNSIARKVLLAFRQLPNPTEPSVLLTGREEQILGTLARGKLYKEAADELGISFHTVRKHVQTIYKKLQVSSRAEALRKFTPRFPQR